MIPKEMEGQGQMFVDAVVEGIASTGRKLEADGQGVYMNAILSALLAATAYHLAAIPDEDMRLLLYSEFGMQLADRIIECRENGQYLQSNVITGHMQ